MTAPPVLPVFKAGTITAVAPVAAMPTTAAHFALWNSALPGGKSLYLQTIESTDIVSAAAAIVLQVAAHVSVVPVLKFSGTAAKGPFPLTGPLLPSVAQVASAVTIVNDGVWHPVTPSTTNSSATTTIAAGNASVVQGLYVIPPQGLFSLAVLCSAAGSATCNLYVSWTEQ